MKLHHFLVLLNSEKRFSFSNFNLLDLQDKANKPIIDRAVRTVNEAVWLQFVTGRTSVSFSSAETGLAGGWQSWKSISTCIGPVQTGWAPGTPHRKELKKLASCRIKNSSKDHWPLRTMVLAGRPPINITFVAFCWSELFLLGCKGSVSTVSAFSSQHPLSPFQGFWLQTPRTNLKRLILSSETKCDLQRTSCSLAAVLRHQTGLRDVKESAAIFEARHFGSLSYPNVGGRLILGWYLVDTWLIFGWYLADIWLIFGWYLVKLTGDGPLSSSGPLHAALRQHQTCFRRGLLLWCRLQDIARPHVSTKPLHDPHWSNTAWGSLKHVFVHGSPIFAEYPDSWPGQVAEGEADVEKADMIAKDIGDHQLADEVPWWYHVYTMFTLSLHRVILCVTWCFGNSGLVLPQSPGREKERAGTGGSSAATCQHIGEGVLLAKAFLTGWTRCSSVQQKFWCYNLW